MQNHASVYEHIWEVFFSEKMRLLPSSAINVGPNGYIQRRAGFDGHRKESLVQFFTESTVVVVGACGLEALARYGRLKCARQDLRCEGC